MKGGWVEQTAQSQMKLVQWESFKHIPQTSSREEIHFRKDVERA